MLSAPVFFDQKDWVDAPADWAPTGIQQGKRYALDEGEGRRIWERCLERAAGGRRYWNVERTPLLLAEGTPRFGAPGTVKPRLGQGLFSLAVRDAYRGACAVTREHSGPVLEAAHILPYKRGGEHRVDNGLLLRSDLHRLFDFGYVTVTADHEFRVGERLRTEFNNGRSYYGLDGSPIALPDDPVLRPNRDFLAWHGREVFRG
jgi:putative restriction endonuclease